MESNHHLTFYCLYGHQSVSVTDGLKFRVGVEPTLQAFQAILPLNYLNSVTIRGGDAYD